MQPSSLKLKSILWQNRRFFLFWALVGLAFRIIFLLHFRLLTDDTFVYGDLARNWLQHGVYGQSGPGGPDPTYIRLPGYPIFLAITWLVAGLEHYTAVLIVQIVADLATCFVAADLARRIASERAAKWAFILTALCPFFANYASVGLTETWAIFLAALAFDSGLAALDEPTRRLPWILCGIALGAGILLRPDGGILLIVFGIYALLRARRVRSRQMVAGAVLTGAIALAPLVPWTVRNWLTFHELQPLTTFSATMPGEFVPHGFQQWVGTWTVDYSSVEDVWFKVDGETVTVADLPPRACDSQAQCRQTQALFDAYAADGYSLSPATDAGFRKLAQERIRAHPLRYYAGLPVLRAVDLWMRPRTEMLPIDPHWWRLGGDDPPQFWWAVILGAINLFYVIAAMWTLLQGRVRYAWLFVGFAVVRTAFLAWMPNPEPRYVLECYPALLAIAGAAFAKATEVRLKMALS